MNPSVIRLVAAAVLLLAMVVAIGRWALGSAPSGTIDENGPYIVALVALLVVLVPSIARQRPGWGEIGRAAVIWGGLLVVLMLLYAWLDDIAALLRSITGG